MREDAAAEADLVAGGYRDRVVTELAQNAADAAARGGVPGRLRLWADGSDIHVANVGAPLAVTGLEALSALRASDKHQGTSVGRFGVGFTSVRAVSPRIEVRSTTGSVLFDADRTRAELSALDLTEPESGVPALRLPYPTDAVPTAGWDTEIVLHGVADVDRFLTDAAADAVDLLLELDALASITVQHNASIDEVVRTESPGPGETTEVTIGTRTFWRVSTPSARWFLPVVGGIPTPVRRDVLRAPTRSDEALTLPLLVVADVAMQPDRRRVMPTADPAAIAIGYAAVAHALPSRYRPMVVPVPGFAASDVDESVRQAISDELGHSAWVPTAAGTDVRPSRAVIIESAPPELTAALADVVPGLVSADLSGPADSRALVTAGATVIGLAAVVDALSGLDREPQWWHRVYDALEPLVHDGIAAQECASMPVPLTDGRTVTGPRTVLAVENEHGIGRVSWARVVHPDAMHPLLLRLGVHPARPADLLADPVLAAILDDPDGVTDQLVEDVLMLARALGSGATPVPGLGTLPLRADDGDERAADEMVLPDSPIQRILLADSPFGVVDRALVDRFGVDALRAVGVGWTFTVLTEELPVSPDHDLDDEESWWATLPEDPAQMVAIRDLDLVDEARWPDALTLIAEDPGLRAAIADRSGYSAWWLRRHAEIGGVRLGLLRDPADGTLDGVLDEFDHPWVSVLTSVLAGPVIDDAVLAEEILDRLADDARSVSGGTAVRVHRMLIDAVRGGRLDSDDLDPPPAVRTVSGAVCDPEDALVLDHVMWASVIDPAVAVLGTVDGADTLADLLDLETASRAVTAEVVSAGVSTVVDRDPDLTLLIALTSLDLPPSVTVHPRLTIRCRGAVVGERDVPFWVDGHGEIHLHRPTRENDGGR